jgi:hypothetical protein
MRTGEKSILRRLDVNNMGTKPATKARLGAADEGMDVPEPSARVTTLPLKLVVPAPITIKTTLPSSGVPETASQAPPKLATPASITLTKNHSVININKK